MHELRSRLPEGQGHPEVCHPEHRRGRSRQGHLRGVGLLQLPTPQVVRQTLLLRLVRYPLQGRQEQVQGGPQGQVRN